MITARPLWRPIVDLFTKLFRRMKLRIYFLEERLGTARLVAAAGSKEELVQNNVELKVGKSALNLQLELEKQMVKFSNLLFLFVDKFIC